MATKKDRLLLLIIIIGYVFLSQPTPEIIEEDRIVNRWGDNIMGKEQFLKDEKDFDYNREDMMKVADTLAIASDSTLESIKLTTFFVFNNIEYDSSVSITYCYSETASSVLAKGSGDCVSMSRLTVALLRAQDIPARTVGGCLSYGTDCTPVFALISGAEVPKPEYQYDYKKRGYLHEWVEAWTGTDWVLVEPTAGLVLDKGCGKYHIYSYDTNTHDRCVINNQEYVDYCRAK